MLSVPTAAEYVCVVHLIRKVNQCICIRIKKITGDWFMHCIAIAMENSAHIEINMKWEKNWKWKWENELMCPKARKKFIFKFEQSMIAIEWHLFWVLNARFSFASLMLIFVPSTDIVWNVRLWRSFGKYGNRFCDCWQSIAPRAIESVHS